MNINEFLAHFTAPEVGRIAVIVGDPNNTSNWTFHKQPSINGLPESDVYFSPGLRARPGNKKADVAGSNVLWADLDSPDEPYLLIPPTIKVWSGHGWHLYWVLDRTILDIELLEQLNRILAYDIPTADRSCWNCNRILRVINTVNTKPPAAAVELREVTDYTYEPDDFRILPKVSDKIRKKIVSGDSRGYPSRSERDWAVVCELVRAGASDTLIFKLYRHHKVGERIEEDGDQYLERTIAKAREKIASEPEAEDDAGGKHVHRERATGIVEREDGYYTNGATPRRISTFTIEPKLLLDGSAFEHEDAIVGDVYASGRTWSDVTFTRSAFTNVARMFRECRVAEWQWLGSDSDVRLVLPHLLERLEERGFRRVRASPTLGLHAFDGRAYFLGDRQTLASDTVWDGPAGPLTWLPTHQEHPELRLQPSLNEADLQVLRDNLLKLNTPYAIWSILGWYAAAPLKPWLKERGYRFPILHVTGTKGSGKTSILLYVMQPLFGIPEPRAYDVGTTRFITLALLGSSNAIPISFSEFRFDTVSRFQRYMLLAYDVGHDPRGRADQTTKDYPLSAPFSVDGEDMITDAAVQERIVVVRLHPATVEEGSEAHRAFGELQQRISPLEREAQGLPPFGFGGYYLQQLLGRLDRNELETELHSARRAVVQAFPGKLPDRVRNNYTIAYFGMRLFCHALEVDCPDADVLGEGISLIVSKDTGRGRTMCDDYVEDVINALSTGTGRVPFVWQYNKGDNTLDFQVRASHSWWLERRKRQGRSSLEHEAIRSQLREADYFVDYSIIDRVACMRISLDKAVKHGLDIPEVFPNQMTIRL